MDVVASWFGAITGVFSLIMIFLYLGVWKGQTDTKVNTLWDIYVMDALHDMPELLHHSLPSLTEEGMREIPADLKQCLDKHLCKGKNYGWEVVQCLGLDKVTGFAQSKGWTNQQAIGLLTLYIKTVKGVADAHV